MSFQSAKKCSKVSFYKISIKIQFDYKIDGDTLARKSTIDDLGVLLDSRLTFKEHIDRTCNSGRAVLGFIKRRAGEFNVIIPTALVSFQA